MPRLFAGRGRLCSRENRPRIFTYSHCCPCAPNGEVDLSRRIKRCQIYQSNRAITAHSTGSVRSGAIFPWRKIRTKNSLRRSEEHTSELQSLMRISYAVFSLKKKKKKK